MENSKENVHFYIRTKRVNLADATLYRYSFDFGLRRVGCELSEARRLLVG